MVMNPFVEISLWTLIMMCANFPVNWFWYNLSLFINARKWEFQMGHLPRSTGAFSFLVLFTVFAITFVGAFIDLIFIVPDTISSSGVNFALVATGMILIFGSAVIASWTVLRLRIGPSLVTGFVLAAINPLFWLVIRIAYWNGNIILIPVFFLILALISQFILLKWHRDAKSEIPPDGEEIEKKDGTLNSMKVRKWAVITAVIMLIILLPIISNAVFPPQPYWTPTITTIRIATATAMTWTVTVISGEASILKGDVYVQVKDANDTYTITTEALLTATGTHGFEYTPISAGNNIAVGDEFSLDNTIYGQGSSLTLVRTASATGQYCVLVV